MEEAIGSFRQGIELVRRIGSMYGLINCLEGLAAAAATDHPIRTATLFAVALKMRDENRMPRTLPEESLISRFIDLARKAVTQEAWRAATQRGEEMGMDEAVAYALQHSS